MSWSSGHIEVAPLDDSVGKPLVCYMSMDEKGISIKCPGASFHAHAHQLPQPKSKHDSKSRSGSKKPAAPKSPPKRLSANAVMDMVSKPKNIIDPHRPNENQTTSL